MSADRTPMVVAAARALCRMSSDACNVDFDDNWKTYGEDFLQEARTVLDAAGAPELLEALEQAVTSMQDSGYQNGHPAVRAARAAIAKATGATP